MKKLEGTHPLGIVRRAAKTAKMNQVDPHAWLTQTLERIANGWPTSDINALIPWNYQS